MKFRENGRQTAGAAVKPCIGDDAVERLLVLGADVVLVNAFAESSFARAEPAADRRNAIFFIVTH